jgi:hypothetical protein
MAERRLPALTRPLESTAELRALLPEVIAKLEITSLLDIPCGDFYWMRCVSLGVKEYIGADIVGDVIEQNRRLYSDRGDFVRLDLLTDPLPQADAILCRDCLIHLSLRDVRKALENVNRTGSKYFMTTTYPGCVENVDTVVPYWRPLNFEIAPFGFLKPLFVIKDFSDSQTHDRGKYLGGQPPISLWNIW